MVKRLEMHSQTGRPLGTSDWLETLERRLGRAVQAKPVGRPRKRKTG